MPSSSLAESDRLQFWGPKVKSILDYFVDRLVHSANPHPDHFEQTAKAIQSLSQVAKRLKAEDSLATSLQMSRLLQEAHGGRSIHHVKGQLSVLKVKLDADWRKEYPQAAQPSHHTVPVQAGLPPYPEVKRAPLPSPPQAPQAAYQPAAAKPAAPPVDSTYNGTFGYILDKNPVDPDLLQLFMGELPEQLITAEQLLLGLEKNLDDSHQINGLFRVIHSMKGNSGFLALREFTELAHAMENFLAGVRNNSFKLTAAGVDNLLAGLDLLKKMGGNLNIQADRMAGKPNATSLFPVNWSPMIARFQ